MLAKMSVKDALASKPIISQIITVSGRVMRCAGSKPQFIHICDGSTVQTLQCVWSDNTYPSYQSQVVVTGKLVKSLGKGQEVEVLVESLEIHGEGTSEYPIPRIKSEYHGEMAAEKMREQPIYRLREPIFVAIMCVRHALSMAIHKFYDGRGYLLLDTPLITSSDCEGAGETFQVVADPKFGEFFGPGQKAYLTVSGQLQGEAGALAFGKIYTFGTTCRAEPSRTSRHAAAFVMVEPEILHGDLDTIRLQSEELIKFCIDECMSRCPSELDFLASHQKASPGEYAVPLIQKLKDTSAKEFSTITYTKAIELLEYAVSKGKKFELAPEWGMDLKSEHERYLCEEVYKGPLRITHYPADLKAFYMHECEPDSKGRVTVACMDVMLPGIGEVIGGSQREVRYDVLKRKMEKVGLDMERYQWYLDLRKFGSAPHAGFGLGFDRLLRFITGIEHIRDVQPFPVVYKCDLA